VIFISGKYSPFCHLLTIEMIFCTWKSFFFSENERKKVEKMQINAKKDGQVSRPGFLPFVQKESFCTKATK
jgi:hypothetical protein